MPRPKQPRAFGIGPGAIAVALLSACTATIGEKANADGPGSVTPLPGSDSQGDPEAPPPPYVPASPVLARLTLPQYDNVVRDLFGVEIASHSLEADSRPYLFSVIGAATTSVSELGVDLYGRAAYDIAPAALPSIAPACSATAPLTEACLASFIRDFGARAWRRPLDASELDRYQKLGVSMGLDEPQATLEHVTAAMLQSPNFLYRVELGEPDPDHAGWLRYTGYEIASRLSFLFRNSMPDSELFAAAADGSLVTTDGILAQATRLLSEAEPTEKMVSQLYTEYLDLSGVYAVKFPAEIDPQQSLGASMQTEVLSVINRIALTEQGDMRTLFNTKTTSIDANLASFYGMATPAGGGFAAATFADAAPRAGILTMGALAALNNRPNRTAPTLRGHFVRERLLCAAVPPPPPNIPPIDESDTMATTLREKLARHRANPACSGCHDLMDPIGLGMEDFDRFGRFRTIDDSGAAIDDAGELDGVAFSGTKALGQILAGDPRTTACLVKQLYRYASARIETNDEASVLSQLDESFAQGGYALKPLLLALVTSDGFRHLVPAVK